MKTTHTFGVQFIVRMNRAKDGLVTIYVRVTVDGSKVEISLKRFVDPVSWNAKKGMPRGSRDEIKALNHFLEQVKAKLLDCYQGMQLQDQFVTAETVKNKFLGHDENHHTLLELVEYHNTDLKGSLEPGTMKNYFTTQRYIKKFLKTQYNFSDIPLPRLTFKFIVDFECYLFRGYERKAIRDRWTIGARGRRIDFFKVLKGQLSFAH
jgi:hypothetical protein